MERPDGTPAVWRVRDRATFAAFRRAGVRGRSGPLTVVFVPASDSTPPRVAYAIGRDAGTAVLRNRLRRRLRAAMRELAAPAGAYLVRAEPSAAALPFGELVVHVDAAVTAAAGRATTTTG